ncbi:hypothetical protein, conserved, partial [Eimeria maxima]
LEETGGSQMAAPALLFLVDCFTRLAVGTEEGVVVAYDLRTATKMRVFEGHQGGVSALGFSDDGNWIASYSVAESAVRLWHIMSTVSLYHQEKSLWVLTRENGVSYEITTASSSNRSTSSSSSSSRVVIICCCCSSSSSS